MVAAAVVGAGALAAGATVYGASKAAGAQSDASSQATALQKQEYDQTRADYAPYRETGYSALGKLSDLLGLSGNTSAAGYGSLNQRFTGANLASEPGYQFELNQGLNAAQNSAAARGGLYSGATLKALTQYGNDYAGTKYNEAYNRFNTDQSTTFNRLSGVAGTGQTATNSVTAAGQNYANQAGENMIGAGNARASSYLAGTNALSNGLNQGAAWWQRAGPGTTPDPNNAGWAGVNGFDQSAYGSPYGP